MFSVPRDDSNKFEDETSTNKTKPHEAGG